MFLIEAIPAVALTPIVLRVLCDKPDHAGWLTQEERDWLNRRLASDNALGAAQRTGHLGVMQLLRSPLILLLGAAYFGITGFNYGLSFFLPQIIQQFGFSTLQTGFVSAIPFAVAAIGMTLWGRHSDRHDERRKHLLVPLALAVFGLAGSTLVAAPVVKMVLICVAAFGVFSALPIYWTLPSTLLSQASAAAGIAIVNSMGNLSGFVNPYVLGVIKDATGSFSGGLQVIAGFGLVSLCILGTVTRGTAWARPAEAPQVRAGVPSGS